ncbi:hypothetical protein [Methylogaea oryzae]|uniref:Uncharacterized protein n=1 Tax=Methylogaea oryzae TaxID=1295382 RepID=A0A8D5AH42_9GAMM|nr:hypothetical protein [Methylogaea oryzae]BBL71068.1 hypothetical protein MoryE10_16740 [Methylogaea oryzae]
MKRIAYAALGLLFAGAAQAGAEHYLRTAGSHVQHLKIVTQKNGDKIVSMDVDFEPGEGEKDAHACSVDISGEAKKVSDTELVLRKQSESERRYCTLNVTLQGDAATVKQSEDCSYFLGHFCKFDSEGDTLKKVR